MSGTRTRTLFLIGLLGLGALIPVVALGLPPDAARVCLENWRTRLGPDDPETIVIIAERVLTCLETEPSPNPDPSSAPSGDPAFLGPGLDIDDRDPRRNPDNWTCKQLETELDKLRTQNEANRDQIEATLDLLGEVLEQVGAARQYETDVYREWSDARHDCMVAGREYVGAVTAAANSCEHKRGQARLDCIEAAADAVPQTILNERAAACDKESETRARYQRWGNTIRGLEQSTQRLRNDLRELQKNGAKLSAQILEVQIVAERRRQSGECRKHKRD